MNSIKPFCTKLHQESNALSISTATDYLIWTGHYTYDSTHPLDQPEVFKDSDFTLVKKSTMTPIKIEVEHKKSWKKSGCWEGFPTLDVPARKRESKAKIFVMLNEKADTLALIKMKDVLESPTYTKNTIYTKNEEFFAVNLEMIKFVTKKDSGWVCVK